MPLSQSSWCPVVITLGGERKEIIIKMLNDLEIFSDPIFFPGVPQKELRNCYKLLQHAGMAGILPCNEWNAIQERGKKLYDENPSTWLQSCLHDVSVEERNANHNKLHYSVELWRKCKSLSHPQRKVLACALAHLQALNHIISRSSLRDVDDLTKRKKYFILEDNVRSVVSRINEFVEEDTKNTVKIDDEKDVAMQYFGWLGSESNIEYLYNYFIPSKQDSGRSFPYPLSQDIVQFLPDYDPKQTLKEGPGGTILWGAFAYYIHIKGIKSIIEELQKDVGALVWKGKRMKLYSVKPIDKVIPRMLLRHGYEPNQIRCCSNVRFVRAPMLQSTLHTQYDEAYCKSTTKQLEFGNHTWKNHVWLTEEEQCVVSSAVTTGTWNYYAN